MSTLYRWILLFVCDRSWWGGQGGQLAGNSFNSNLSPGETVALRFFVPRQSLLQIGLSLPRFLRGAELEDLSSVPLRRRKTSLTSLLVAVER